MEKPAFHEMGVDLIVGNVELIHIQKPNEIKHSLIVPEIRA